MYCRKCGNEIQIDSKFCQKCGTPVKQTTGDKGYKKYVSISKPVKILIAVMLIVAIASGGCIFFILTSKSKPYMQSGTGDYLIPVSATVTYNGDNYPVNIFWTENNCTLNYNFWEVLKIDFDNEGKFLVTNIEKDLKINCQYIETKINSCCISWDSDDWILNCSHLYTPNNKIDEIIVTANDTDEKVSSKYNYTSEKLDSIQYANCAGIVNKKYAYSGNIITMNAIDDYEDKGQYNWKVELSSNGLPSKYTSKTCQANYVYDSNGCITNINAIIDSDRNLSVEIQWGKTNSKAQAIAGKSLMTGLYFPFIEVIDMNNPVFLVKEYFHLFHDDDMEIYFF